VIELKTNIRIKIGFGYERGNLGGVVISGKKRLKKE